MLALVDAVSTFSEREAPCLADEARSPLPPFPRAAHHLASLGGESSKPKPETKVGLRSAVFGGVNTVRSRSNLEDERVKSGTMDGHGLMTTKIGGLAAPCCAGGSARGLQGREN